MDYQGPPQSGHSAEGSPGKLFLGGLSWKTSEDTLRTHFGEFGELTDVVIMRDRASNKPRGFGFVTFLRPEVLATKHVLDGVTVDVKRAVARDSSAPRGGGRHDGPGDHHRGGGGRDRPPMDMSPSADARKVFVGGLAPSVDDDAMRTYFAKFGPVAESMVMYDQDTTRSRGFGFVTFGEDGIVERILGQPHSIHEKAVEIKRAQPRVDRRRGGGDRGGYDRRDRGGYDSRDRGGYDRPPHGGGYAPMPYGGGGYGAPAYGGYPGYSGGYGAPMPGYMPAYPPQQYSYGAPAPQAYPAGRAGSYPPGPAAAAPYGGAPTRPYDDRSPAPPADSRAPYGGSAPYGGGSAPPAAGGYAPPAAAPYDQAAGGYGGPGGYGAGGYGGGYGGHAQEAPGAADYGRAPLGGAASDYGSGQGNYGPQQASRGGRGFSPY